MGNNDSKSWGIRQNVIVPVIANLLTALVLFLCVVFFKEPIFSIFRPPEPVEKYPLYCIAEPYTNDEGLVVSDLYIINLTDDRITESFLFTFLKASSPEEDGESRKPHIELKWRKKFGPGKITKVVEDKEFNEGKGKIEISTPNQDGDPWVIKGRVIYGKAIFRIIVYSDLKKPSVTRGSKRYVPFDIDYPGE